MVASILRGISPSLSRFSVIIKAWSVLPASIASERLFKLDCLVCPLKASTSATVISLLAAGLLAIFCYGFSLKLLPGQGEASVFSFAVSLLVVFEGMFLMVFRKKALAQVIGLLVMENGLFLCAVSLCGSMPFIVEIAIFFDVFVCVMVTGVFIYRIKELFTNIDVSKLTSLKG